MNNLPVSQMTSAYQGVIEQREDIFGSSAIFSLGIDEDLNLESRGPSNRFDALLFGESQGRAVLAVKQKHVSDILSAARETGVDAAEIGTVNRNGRFQAIVGGETVLDVDVKGLRETWQDSIPHAMNSA